MEEDKELENTIKKIQEALEQLGDINMQGSTKERTIYQKRLHKAYDILFSLKKHLEFLKKMEERKRWDLI